MAAIMTNVAAITDMVRVQMEAIPLDAIVGLPILHSVRQLVKQLTTFASHFATTKWGGKHGFPPSRPKQSQDETGLREKQPGLRAAQ